MITIVIDIHTTEHGVEANLRATTGSGTATQEEVLVCERICEVFKRAEGGKVLEDRRIIRDVE